MSRASEGSEQASHCYHSNILLLPLPPKEIHPIALIYTLNKNWYDAVICERLLKSKIQKGVKIGCRGPYIFLSEGVGNIKERKRSQGRSGKRRYQ